MGNLLFDNLSLLNRVVLAFFTSSILTIVLAKHFIKWVLKFKNAIQPIRADGPTTHLSKQGTPSLGGILILATFFISSLLWVQLFTSFNITILIVTLLFALIGFVDDYLKLVHKNSKGLSGKVRLLGGFVIAFFAVYSFMQHHEHLQATINIFFSKQSFIYAGIVITLLFSTFVLVGTVNSVNLTDGLDGLVCLVSITVLIGFITYTLLLYFNAVTALRLNFTTKYTLNITESAVLIAAMIGSLVGFLWVNSNPAEIFMGDVGSLGIGGFIACLAVAFKQEIFLAIIGLIYVLESMSVIIQVYYFKLSKGKRILLMAPMHHHFEKKGYAENKIVYRIWILSIILCVLGVWLLGYFGA